MKLAVMQPYFFPYLGYFQLIANVDVFVVYDDVKYTKRGWINRNRILLNNQIKTISLPIAKASDYKLILERQLAEHWPKQKLKILSQLKQQYQKSPYFEDVMVVVSKVLNYDTNSLFEFNFNLLKSMCDLLEVNTQIISSSSVENTSHLKAENKLYSLCAALNADVYINPVGGQSLYSKHAFQERSIELQFIEMDTANILSKLPEEQRSLSILHILFSLGVTKTKQLLRTGYLIR